MGKKGNNQKKKPVNRFIGSNELSNLGINSSKIQQGINNTPRKVQSRGFTGKKKK